MAKYWLSTISLRNFEIDRGNDFSIAGFAERDLEKVIQVEPGDHIAFYVKGKGFGLLCSARSRCFVDWKPVWPEDTFPCRFERNCQLVLPPHIFLHPKAVFSRLSFIPEHLKDSRRWGTAFRHSLRQISRQDFEVIAKEMRQLAKEHG